MKTTTILNNAIALMQLNIMNLAEMPVDQAIQAVTAIAALAQAEAALAQAEAAQRISNAVTYIAGVELNITREHIATTQELHRLRQQVARLEEQINDTTHPSPPPSQAQADASHWRRIDPNRMIGQSNSP